MESAAGEGEIPRIALVVPRFLVIHKLFSAFGADKPALAGEIAEAVTAVAHTKEVAKFLPVIAPVDSHAGTPILCP